MVSATTSAKTSAMVSATVSATTSAMISAMLSATVSAMVSDCGGLPLSASVLLSSPPIDGFKMKNSAVIIDEEEQVNR